MPQEIERKFLIMDDGWRSGVRASHKLVQGYLARGKDSVVRVRVIEAIAADVLSASARLTIKSTAPGLIRDEFEYPIPLDDARSLLRACETSIEKIRHDVDWDGLIWSVDEFRGALSGLFLAEVELASPDQIINVPLWAGREVTNDPDYRNESLAQRDGPLGC